MLMLAFVALKSCGGEEGDRAFLDSVPQAPAPDADTPADTIKTLTANVAAMTAEVGALRRDNATLKEESQALLSSRVQIEENVATRVKRELLARMQTNDDASRLNPNVLSSLTARMDALTESIAQTQSDEAGRDIPIGLGFDGITPGVAARESVVWIEPLDSVEPTTAEEGLLEDAERTQTRYLGTARVATNTAASRVEERMQATRAQPAYTIPRNATLIDSTAMTALVGRVPVQGQVRDPMPFKVITGAENLAANGLTVPGVQGMVWSGTAIGDWTLSCVTGRLDSVTFVFDDGTIRTLSGDDVRGQGGGGKKPLGWISDAYGIPCVSGARKTNAPAFLSQRIAAGAIEAASQAAAAAETTSVLSETGSITSSVTGETGRFVLGKTIARGSDEVSKWLLERQSQSFDAVFVPAGTKVAIHVDRELPIDFDPTGRKLAHAIPIQRPHRARLD